MISNNLQWKYDGTIKRSSNRPIILCWRLSVFCIKKTLIRRADLRILHECQVTYVLPTLASVLSSNTMWGGQVTNGASDAITHFGFKMIRLCHVKSKVCQKYVSLPKGFGQQLHVEIFQNDNSKFISVVRQNLFQINNRCTFS